MTERSTNLQTASLAGAAEHPAGGPGGPGGELSGRLAARRDFLRRRGMVAAGRAQRWAAWARALAERFRAGRLRGVGAALLFERRAGRGASDVLRQERVERVERIERVRERLATMLFAPRLHLTIAPLLRLGGAATARPILRSTALSNDAAVEKSGVAVPPAFHRDRAPALARALMRCGPGALPPGPALTLARARQRVPLALAAEPLALAGRVAARGRREETALPRPAATLHRSSPAAPPSEVEAEISAHSGRSRRRAPSAGVAGTALAAAAAAPLAVAPGELDRLTEQVVRRIDRRMAAWRERTGRV